MTSTIATGLHWVKVDGQWEVARLLYTTEAGVRYWDVIGTDRYQVDKYFEEIGAKAEPNHKVEEI